jgi:hypothetical protein
MKPQSVEPPEINTENENIVLGIILGVVFTVIFYSLF